MRSSQPLQRSTAKAARAAETDWRQIVRLYNRLERVEPSPVISLNRAAAIAMAEGPSVALTIIDALAETGGLENYHLFHTARADLLRRTGSREEAAKSYLRAIALVTNASGFTSSGACAKCKVRNQPIPSWLDSGLHQLFHS
jgi:predicted RNA polymerase sigma factor